MNRNSLPIGCEKREATNRRRTWSCCVFVDAVYNKKEIVTHSRLGQLRYGSYDERNFALLSDVHFYGTMVSCPCQVAYFCSNPRRRFVASWKISGPTWEAEAYMNWKGRQVGLKCDLERTLMQTQFNLQGFNLNASIAFYDQKLSELISIWMYRYEQEPGIKGTASLACVTVTN